MTTEKAVVLTPFQARLRRRMPAELLDGDTPLSNEDAARVVRIAILESFSGWDADTGAVARAAVEGLRVVRPQWFE